MVEAFLAGAGVTDVTETAEWGEIRRQQAVAGMAELIRAAVAKRESHTTYDIVPVALPVEPELVDPAARDAYNDDFLKHVQFGGWQHNIMPMASFDAATTEWELAHLLD